MIIARNIQQNLKNNDFFHLLFWAIFPLIINKKKQSREMRYHLFPKENPICLEKNKV